MGSSKRQHSPGDAEGASAKKPKTSIGDAIGDGGDAIAEMPPAPHIDQVDITVSIASSSKAAENDPKLFDHTWERFYARFNQEVRDKENLQDTLTDAQPSVGIGAESTFSLAQPNARERGTVPDELRDPDELDNENSDQSSLDEFAEWKWMEQIDSFATVNKQPVGDCDAKLIRRNRIRARFWEEMEEPSQETSNLAFELFERHGHLKREYYEHDFRKGTGVWGAELDQGDILLLTKLRVDQIWRRHKVGTRLVEAILEKTRAKSTRFFALARPGWLTAEVPLVWKDGEEEATIIKEHEDIALRFWRSLGFRRVGTSPWFALTDDDSHPSRKLKPSQDWDATEQLVGQGPMPELVDALFRSLSNPGISDGDCVRQLQNTLPVDPDDSCWLLTDEGGNTLLHVAATSSKPEVIKHILYQNPRLANMRNNEGYTPVEALRSRMEVVRARMTLGLPTIVESDEFTGFPPSYIASMGALTNTQICDLTKLSEQILSAASAATDENVDMVPYMSTIRQTLRLKYGCTCGECIGGFLSPRMRCVLLYQTKSQHDILEDDLLHMSGWEWVTEHELEYLQASVLQELTTNKSVRQGFVNVCGHITECLDKKMIPNETNVLCNYQIPTNESRRATRKFLQGGGTVSDVAKMLFRETMILDQFSGSGYYEGSVQDEIEELPECRNDSEFGFVSGMCGY